ncbi:MAG: hypothetical protein ACFFCW_45285, partial [Candidatus Hodarchaeota archaeon]
KGFLKNLQFLNYKWIFRDCDYETWSKGLNRPRHFGGSPKYRTIGHVPFNRLRRPWLDGDVRALHFALVIARNLVTKQSLSCQETAWLRWQ